MHVLRHGEKFVLENGAALDDVSIGYHTWGTLNAAADNVIWICHALTGSANAQDWWPGMIGEGLAFDTTQHFIVCANIIGSCYGSSGPLSTSSAINAPYYHSFPSITIRDMVKAQQLLQQHLGIKKIQLLVGGSMGGYQALEWCAMQPELIQKLFLLATSAKETAWGIAIHTAQRMAIETDATWGDDNELAGIRGLKTARAIGMLTYRNYQSFISKQNDDDTGKLDDYKASSYIIHQGNKLAARFNAYSYWYLTKAMDTHNLARGRKSLEEVLGDISCDTFIIGVSSDYLCPPAEQDFLRQHIPNASLIIIDSEYGHDGFLVETKAITHHLLNWLNKS